MQSELETIISTAGGGGGGGGSGGVDKKYKGVRRRSWGKWVSEIRVPGTRERLWLGTYANPEAAAFAHDAAVFFLRGPDRASGFNFPDRVGRFVWTGLSPRSVQQVASDAGMAVDAELADKGPTELARENIAMGCDDVANNGGWGWESGWNGNGCAEEISIEDMDFYV